MSRFGEELIVFVTSLECSGLVAIRSDRDAISGDPSEELGAGVTACSAQERRGGPGVDSIDCPFET